MTLIESLKNSWKLLVSSWKFLQKNKDLIILPIIGLIASVSVAVYLLFACHFGTSVIDILKACNPNSMSNSACRSFLLKLTVFYLIASVITIYSNASLLIAVSYRMQGKSCQIYQALQLVGLRWRAVLGWGLISATMNIVLHIIESSHRAVREIFGVMLGAAWSLTEYFVLPIMVFENIGPIKSIKQSAKLLGRGWRRVVSVNLFISLVIVGVLLSCYLLLQLTSLCSTQIHHLMSTLTFVAVLLFVTLGNVFNAIVKTALYLSMRGDAKVSAFDQKLLDRAFIQNSCK